MTRLTELLLAWQDRTISSAEIAELKKLLAAREQRAALAQEFLLTGVILESVRMLQAVEDEQSETLPAPSDTGPKTSFPVSSIASACRRLLVVGGLVFCLVVVFFGMRRSEPSADKPGTPFAQVQETQGATFVVSQKEKHPAARGQVIVPGEGIATEGERSEAIVNMDDAVRLTLTGDTTVFTAFDRTQPLETRLFLEKGDLQIDVTRSLKRKKTTIQTRLGSVTAQQEETSLHLSESVGVVVIRGEADFQHKTTGKTIRLRSGEYLAIDLAGELYTSRLAGGTGEVWTTFPRTGLSTVSLGYALAFSPQGNLAAVQRFGEGGGRTGPLHPPNPTIFKGERCVQFSPDGRWLAAGDQADVFLYGLPGHTGPRVLAGKNRKARVQCLAFSPDGKRLALGRTAIQGQAQVELWDLTTDTLKQVLHGHLANLHAIAFSPDGQYLASAGLDRTAIVWNVESGQEATRIVVNPAHAIWALAFAPRGGVLALACGPSDFRLREDSEMVLWDYHREKIEQRFSGHGRAVTSVVFSTDGETLITGSADGTVRFWERATGRQYALFKGHKAAPGFEAITLALSPDGQTLATASFDQTVRLWPTTWIHVLQSQLQSPLPGMQIHLAAGGGPP